MENKMSYKLADGSMSTDYKVGDKFMLDTNHVRIFVFTKDDDTTYPWFREAGYNRDHVMYWDELTPVKEGRVSTIINQLRETVKQLEATIKELEHEE